MPDKEEALKKLLVLCLVFLGLGVLMFVMAILQTLLFAKAGARLTQRIRYEDALKLLRYQKELHYLFIFKADDV